MKKIIFLVLLAILPSEYLKSQNWLESGESFINIGYSMLGSEGRSSIFSSYEYVYDSEISVGTVVSYTYYTKQNDIGPLHIDNSNKNIAVSLKFCYHFYVDDLFDYYSLGEAGISFNQNESKITEYNLRIHNPDFRKNDFVIGLFAGARYLFLENVGIFGEIGYGNNGIIRSGFTFRF